MEFIWYILLIGFSLVLTVNRTAIRSERTFKVLYFVISLCTIVLVRFTSFDTDIQSYADSLDGKMVGFYYFREPVVWFGLKFLNMVTKNPTLTFIIADTIIFSIVYFAFRRFKVPQYAYISFMTFFPFILGMQNAYRQWVATIIVIYCLSLGVPFIFRRMFIFLIAVLSHNAVGPFAPLLFIGSRALWAKGAGILLTLFMPIIIILGAQGKSATALGASMEAYYLLLISLLLFFFLLSDRLKLSKNNRMLTLTSLYLIGLSLASILTLSSMASERLSLISLTLLYPYIAIKIEQRFKSPWPLRAILIFFGFFPIIFFDTAHFVMRPV